jgi:hypothetical protein
VDVDAGEMYELYTSGPWEDTRTPDMVRFSPNVGRKRGARAWLDATVRRFIREQ